VDATVNHADGNIYTSKSKFRAATRAAGFEEVGNEKVAHHKQSENVRKLPPGLKQALVDACDRHGVKY
jgi:hypothetical protein